MRLLLNSLLLLLTLLISAVAFGKKTRAKESSPPVPVVAVANLKVDSTNENVQKKIAALTDKVRDAVASSTTNCNVINSKQMRSLMKKHAKAIAKCYDDCDVELGLLVGADFVIGGRLAPTADSVMTTLEIRDTRTRNIVASKTIEGNNYFALEASLLSAVRRFVKPLNNVVYQAVDEEVIKDAPAQQPVAAGPADPFAPVPAQNNGAGQPTTANPESEYLAPKLETRQAPPSALDLRWASYKDEPSFLKNEDLGFQENKAGVFGLGVTVGYPFNVARAKQLQSLYTPIFHVGVQLMARVHHMLEIAVVADIDYLSGNIASDHRFGNPGLANCLDPDDWDEQNTRGCYQNGSDAHFRYSYDDPSLNFYRNNTYEAGSYFSVGVRPTIRLVIPMGIVDTILGAGIGVNYAKTSGWWETYAHGNEFLQSGSQTTEEVSENLVYTVAVANIGFYGAFEAAVVFRLLGKRLGIGPYLEYKLPTMWSKGVDADVTVQNRQGVDSYLSNGRLSAFGPASTPQDLEQRKSDILESPLGHTEMMNLLTIGLTADWRF